MSFNPKKSLALGDTELYIAEKKIEAVKDVTIVGRILTVEGMEKGMVAKRIEEVTRRLSRIKAIPWGKHVGLKMVEASS